jgi:hypothetical protein
MPNVEFTEQLKARLRNDPLEYDQANFVPYDECNTAVCLAGHAYLIVHPELNPLDLKKVNTGILCQTAQTHLGIDLDSADVLFGYADEWPKQFAFDGDTPRALQVEKACAILDFIASGENLYDAKAEEP